MGKIKIVIADDNREFCYILSKFIQEEENFEIIGIANDGIETLELIEKLRPDIVILDIIMPYLDGLGVLEKLSYLYEDYFPKIMVLSAVGQDKIIQQAIELGADYYMVKPFDFNVLLDRLRQIVKKDIIKREIIKKEQEVFYKDSSKESDMEIKITKIIQEIGVPAHIKGYIYI